MLGGQERVESASDSHSGKLIATLQNHVPSSETEASSRPVAAYEAPLSALLPYKPTLQNHVPSSETEASSLLVAACEAPLSALLARKPTLQIPAPPSEAEASSLLVAACEAPLSALLPSKPSCASRGPATDLSTEPWCDEGGCALLYMLATTHAT